MGKKLAASPKTSAQIARLCAIRFSEREIPRQMKLARLFYITIPNSLKKKVLF